MSNGGGEQSPPSIQFLMLLRDCLAVICGSWYGISEDNMERVIYNGYILQ